MYKGILENLPNVPHTIISTILKIEISSHWRCHKNESRSNRTNSIDISFSLTSNNRVTDKTPADTDSYHESRSLFCKGVN